MDILVPLTENHEYKRVYARGKSAVRPALVLYCLRNKKVKQARVGITASKKIGNAVKRNRARRLLRESIRVLYPQLKPGYDFVLVSRGRTLRPLRVDILFLKPCSFFLWSFFG